MTREQSRRRALVWMGGWAASSLCPAQSAQAPFRMAVSNNYAPFYFVENDRIRGIAVDILDEVIRKQMGMALAFEAFPWARAQMMVQRYEFDAMCTIATPERLAYTVASDEPVLINNFHLFVHKDNPLLPALRRVRSLAGLLALRPTAISYAGSGWSKANLSGIELVLTGTFDNVMRMLMARRADIVVDGEYNVRYWLASHPEDAGALNAADIVMLPLVYEATRFTLLVGKTSPHVGMLPEFNARMKHFRTTPAYRQIFQSYGAAVVEA